LQEQCVQEVASLGCSGRVHLNFLKGPAHKRRLHTSRVAVQTLARLSWLQAGVKDFVYSQAWSWLAKGIPQKQFHDEVEEGWPWKRPSYPDKCPCMRRPVNGRQLGLAHLLQVELAGTAVYLIPASAVTFDHYPDLSTQSWWNCWATHLVERRLPSTRRAWRRRAAPMLLKLTLRLVEHHIDGISHVQVKPCLAVASMMLSRSAEAKVTFGAEVTGVQRGFDHCGKIEGASICAREFGHGQQVKKVLHQQPTLDMCCRLCSFARGGVLGIDTANAMSMGNVSGDAVRRGALLTGFESACRLESA
jgi:hypothetical protein